MAVLRALILALALQLGIANSTLFNMTYSPYQTHVSPLEPYRIPSGVFFTDFGPEVPLDCSPATIFPIFPNARPAVNPGVAPPADKFPRSPSQSKPQQVLCLPLLGVAIDVRVDSTIATTRFMQQFNNISNIAIPEAHYTFPIYDGAAVTAFRYYIGDSEVLIGKVLSNEEAVNEYMRAIAPRGEDPRGVPDDDREHSA